MFFTDKTICLMYCKIMHSEIRFKQVIFFRSQYTNSQYCQCPLKKIKHSKKTWCAEFVALKPVLLCASYSVQLLSIQCALIHHHKRRLWNSPPLWFTGHCIYDLWKDFRPWFITSQDSFTFYSVHLRLKDFLFPFVFLAHWSLNLHLWIQWYNYMILRRVH